MRKLIIALSLSLFVFGGCVTMPDPVPNGYLVDKTQDQTKNMEKLEDLIIAKNHDIQKLRDGLKASDQKLKVEKGRLDILRDEKKLLEEKQKQYQLEKDSVKISENMKLITDKEDEAQVQMSKVDYAEAFRNNNKAQTEVAESELAVLVAELNFEKSRIAREYIQKKATAMTPEEKKASALPDPLTYDEKYRKYLEKQREILVEKRNARDETGAKLKSAEDKIKK